MKPNKTQKVCNLVFPIHIDELNIGEYRFTKIINYKNAFVKLHHTTAVHCTEYSTVPNLGSHQVTAEVIIPNKQPKASLTWGHKSPTQLDDILLLLSLFTQRDVFLRIDNLNDSIVRDHRKYCFGGQLSSSLAKLHEYINPFTGEKYSQEQLKQGVTPRSIRDLGFESSLNDILKLISDDKWRLKYNQGYFLFLYKNAMQSRFVDIAFILCWTIWEHLFSITTIKWLDEKTILNTNGSNKIAFVLHQYFNIEISDKRRGAIDKITKARNRLVHFGEKPDSISFDEMRIFIHMTDQLIAILLGLVPSNILNSLDKLHDFLDGKDVKHCYSFHF